MAALRSEWLAFSYLCDVLVLVKARLAGRAVGTDAFGLRDEGELSGVP